MKIIVSVVVFFLSPEFSFRLISQTFRLEIGQREGLLRRIIVFLANLRRFGLRHDIFKKILFQCSFFFCQNSDSLKLVQLFDWKWVNRLDSIRGSSFFGQIPSFRPRKWHFFENYHFSALFFFRRNLDSRKFVKLLKWKWVNSQDSKGGSSFFRQIPSFRPSK